MPPMRIVRQSTVKQFTTEKPSVGAGIVLSLPRIWRHPAFYLDTPMLGVMHDSVVSGDHREIHAGRDFYFYFKRGKPILSNLHPIG